MAAEVGCLASTSSGCCRSEGGEDAAAVAAAGAAAAAAASATVGDLLGTLGKLRSLLRRMHYPAAVAAASIGSEWCGSTNEQAALASGAVDTLLPILHFALCDFSANVHSFVRRRGFEFLFKSDRRFVEEVWKFLVRAVVAISSILRCSVFIWLLLICRIGTGIVAAAVYYSYTYPWVYALLSVGLPSSICWLFVQRQQCGYRPALTPSQFLTPAGFAERKLLLCCDVLRIVRAVHNHEVQGERRKNRPPQQLLETHHQQQRQQYPAADLALLQQQQQQVLGFVPEDLKASKRTALSLGARSSSSSNSVSFRRIGERQQQEHQQQWQQQQQQQQQKQGASSRSGSAPLSQARMSVPPTPPLQPTALRPQGDQQAVSALLQNVSYVSLFAVIVAVFLYKRSRLPCTYT